MVYIIIIGHNDSFNATTMAHTVYHPNETIAAESLVWMVDFGRGRLLSIDKLHKNRSDFGPIQLCSPLNGANQLHSLAHALSAAFIFHPSGLRCVFWCLVFFLFVFLYERSAK